MSLYLVHFAEWDRADVVTAESREDAAMKALSIWFPDELSRYVGPEYAPATHSDLQYLLEEGDIRVVQDAPSAYAEEG